MSAWRGPLKEADGQHDFDWDIGTWTTYQKRLLHPLAGSDLGRISGTDVVRKIWDGANLGEIRATGPEANLELFTLRLYNPRRMSGVSTLPTAQPVF
jgi:hypothetical protein